MKGVKMNKVLNKLNEQLENKKQDLKSLESISSENDVCESIDFVTEQIERLEENISVIEQFKRDLENDIDISDIMESIRIFKENVKHSMFTIPNKRKGLK